MLLECSCGKMYRVRDDTASPPTRCPACGGTLRVSGAPSSPAAPAADPRLRELESRLQTLERETSSARAAVELKDQEIEEMAGRLANAQKAREEALSELGKAKSETHKSDGGTREYQKKDQELREKVLRVAALEKELQETRVKAQSAGLAALKEKDSELHYARERIAALEREMGQGAGTKRRLGPDDAAAKELAQARERILALEKDAEARLQEKETEHRESQEAISKLGEELSKAQAAYRSALAEKSKEVEDAHGRISTLERQTADGGSRGPGGKPDQQLSAARAEVEQKSAELGRVQSRISMLERIVQDGEKRYRDLQADFDKGSSKSSASSVAASESEKDRRVAQLTLDLSNGRDVEVVLRKQIHELEASVHAEKSARRALEKSKSAAPVPAAPAVQVDQARYLAQDLEKNLGSVAASLAGLVDRVKRLHESLNQVAAAAPPASPARAPEPEVSEEPAPEPSLPEAEAMEAEAMGLAEPEAPPQELSEEAPASEEPATLESLPEPEPQAEELPADETMLDMGPRPVKKGTRFLRGRGFSSGLPRGRMPAPTPARMEPQERGAEEVPAEEIPAEEASFEEAAPEGEAPLDAQAAEAEETQAPEPKKKGLFGKLFGKKK